MFARAFRETGANCNLERERFKMKMNALAAILSSESGGDESGGDSPRLTPWAVCRLSSVALAKGDGLEDRAGGGVRAS